MRLEAVLAGAVATSQPEVHVDYVDWSNDGTRTSPAPYRTALNSASDVTILAAPTFNPVREPVYIGIHNKDTASVVVTVKTDDGTTERIVIKRTLAPDALLEYTKYYGWRV
jgi:hypothetical protein